QSNDGKRAPGDAEEGERVRFGEGAMKQAERGSARREHDPGGQDEERVPGRMRLVPGDVVIVDAEREVDRVEIFERGWQREEVDGEKRRGEHAGEAERRLHAWRRSNPSLRLPVR